MRAIAICGLVTVLSYSLAAQRPVSTSAPKGTVTGHVICDDTQRPGRLVSVSLMRKLDSAGDAKQKEGAEQLLLSARTALDGSFTLSFVPVGEYWAIAQSVGYILPIASVKAAEDLKSAAKVMAEFPVVRVTAERPVEVNLVLHRGGVVSGHVRFDDGTPVSGAAMTLVPVDKVTGTSAAGLMALNQITYRNNSSTDDSGAYRIAGVAPGKYRVLSTLQVFGGATTIGNGNGYSVGGGNEVYLEFFAPGTLHKAASPTLEVKGSEEFPDTDFTIDLSSMHSVSGKAVGKEDHVPVNGGTAHLKDTNDKDLDTEVDVDASGSFVFPYVPSGSFELTVEGANYAPSENPMNPWNRKKLQSYAAAHLPVEVTDQDLTVPEVLLGAQKPGQKNGDNQSAEQ